MHFKTVFISDTHLGAKKSKSDAIYKFLKQNTFDEIYLVGDIIDIWRFKQAFSLSSKKKKEHLQCIMKLLKMSSNGVKIHYVYGNHDVLMERFIFKELFYNIDIVEECAYTDSNGETWKVIHGHQYDLVTKYAFGEKLGKFGDMIYDVLISVNEIYNKLRKIFGFKYTSISKYMKVKFKKASMFLDNFEKITLDKAIDDGYSGVITGHIHDPKINGYYVNCGCWTDYTNLSFVVDNGDGMELWKYNWEKKKCERIDDK